MARGNGKSDIEAQPLDLEHELPASEEEGGDAESSRAVSEPAADNEVARLRAERETLIDRLARLQAEFDNARKRASREQQEFREYALTESVKQLLPILDSFERAVQSEHPDKDEFRNGVELIYKQLQHALGKLGLRPIPAAGEIFDPRLHQAIQMVDTTEAEDHQVLDELQRGYKLKDRLLRPSMVRVARNPKH
jgi:molecular chaperone GrpE